MKYDHKLLVSNLLAKSELLQPGNPDWVGLRCLARIITDGCSDEVIESSAWMANIVLPDTPARIPHP